MDSANKNNSKAALKNTTAKLEQPSTTTTSANHSAPKQAVPFNLKRRKNRTALAGW